MYMGFSLHHDSQLGDHPPRGSISTCCYDGVAAAVTTLHVRMGALYGGTSTTTRLEILEYETRRLPLWILWDQYMGSRCLTQDIRYDGT